MIKGFERAWTMQVGSTLACAMASELRVHVVSFKCDESLKASDALAIGLPWPETIERSVSRRRAEFFFGRLAARHALESESPSLADGSVLIGSHHEPLWPATIIGSITHVAGLAGAAVASTCTWRFLGVDIERPVRGESQQALRALALNETELNLLHTVSPVQGKVDMDARVTQVFSAKESLYKAAFPTVRRFFDFSAAQLCEYQVGVSKLGPEARLTLEMCEDVGGAFVAGSRWSVEVWPVLGTDASLSVLAG
ncbi:MAG TPA: 4'-phosphopantetheinyl transferase superfamily protein [Gammaproteobacteria bacterium]|nr:4'-phosphopantetheinyl transferase superfamily protein [Gammaproteobacteria bacterium]HIM99313.1 4'-phosphopantetheinyl transferase superfamily protein [Gammaproteobacteria bacterium]